MRLVEASQHASLRNDTHQFLSDSWMRTSGLDVVSVHLMSAHHGRNLQAQLFIIIWVTQIFAACILSCIMCAKQRNLHLMLVFDGPMHEH